MAKAVGYVRVPEDVLSDQDSADAQRLRIRIWARETGYKLDDIHQEPDTPLHGSSLETAVQSLDSGDVLVVDRVALAAPTVADWVSLCDRLAQAGIAVAAVSDGFDTLPESPGGTLVTRAMRAIGSLHRINELAETQQTSQASQASAPRASPGHNKEVASNSDQVAYLNVYDQAFTLSRQGLYEEAVNTWMGYLGGAEGETVACGFNCVGDLYIKDEHPKEAAANYFRAAHSFEKSGFPDRALDMLKKVQRHAPERNDVYLHQGRLNTKMERVTDALAAYLCFARAQVDEGQYDMALDVFDKIRMLDPVNPHFRLGMAEKMRGMGFHEAAIDEIVYAAELLIQQHDSQSAQEQLSRVQGAAPLNENIDILLARIEREAQAPAKTTPALPTEQDFLTPDPSIYHPAQFSM